MGRPLVQRLMVVLAFATALLLPALARAALVPACESHQVTRMPVEWLAQPAASPAAPDACSEVDDAVPQEDLGDSRVAAMCDWRGASVIAPPRVRPIVDARIDRIDPATGCGLDLLTAPVAGPGPDDSPLGAPAFALAQDAVLGAQPLVLPAPSMLAPPYPAAAGAARAGIRRGIDHPPR